jgi:mobilome CxxCx(11)CxxC protein
MGLSESKKQRLEQARIDSLSAIEAYKTLLVPLEKKDKTLTIASFVIPIFMLSITISVSIFESELVDQILGLIVGPFISSMLLLFAAIKLAQGWGKSMSEYTQNLAKNQMYEHEVATILESPSADDRDADFLLKRINDQDIVDQVMLAKISDKRPIHLQALKNYGPRTRCRQCGADPWNFTPGDCQMCGNVPVNPN